MWPDQSGIRGKYVNIECVNDVVDKSNFPKTSGGGRTFPIQTKYKRYHAIFPGTSILLIVKFDTLKITYGT